MKVKTISQSHAAHRTANLMFGGTMIGIAFGVTKMQDHIAFATSGNDAGIGWVIAIGCFVFGLVCIVSAALYAGVKSNN